MQTKFKAKHFFYPKYWPTWLALGLLRICVWLPYRWQLAIGVALGEINYRLLAERRRIAHINIALCFPEYSQTEQTRLVRACFRNLGIAVLEAALSWWGSEKKLRSLYHIEGLEHIEQAQQQKRPVLLLSGHMTSSDLAARLFALHMPFQALYKRAKNEVFETVMLRARSRCYENMVERKQTKKLLRGLKAGIATWYAPDQNFGREETVFVPFFGVTAASLTATARLAKISGAAVIPFFPYRKPDNSGYVIRISPPLENFPSEDAVTDAARVNRIIETAVRAAPTQYMWLHKRFRTRPPGEAAIY